MQCAHTASKLMTTGFKGFRSRMPFRPRWCAGDVCDNGFQRLSQPDVFHTGTAEGGCATYCGFKGFHSRMPFRFATTSSSTHTTVSKAFTAVCLLDPQPSAHAPFRVSKAFTAVCLLDLETSDLEESEEVSKAFTAVCLLDETPPFTQGMRLWFQRLSQPYVF